MNQKGNEPMMMIHARIPVALEKWLESTAYAAGVSKSEFIRLALEYIQAGNVCIVQKTIFKPTNSER